MRHIWLTWAAFFLAAASIAGIAPPSRAEGAVPPVSAQDRLLGKEDAPVTIIEYGSLTCPHCAEFDRETLPEIKKNWIDTGKVRLVFRLFPLNQLDLHAAMLAHCVPPERYFAFIDTVYKSQVKWMQASDPQQALSNIARLAGVGEDKIKSCLADKSIEDEVVATAYAAQQSGVESTPTFFINGQKPEKNGAQPYDVFDQLLTAAQH
ncbi:MAG TPA: DsbA family protein [Stellaceae bacterium]|nr:DsbA family protein [Stellaceae bacterium]